MNPSVLYDYAVEVACSQLPDYIVAAHYMQSLVNGDHRNLDGYDEMEVLFTSATSQAGYMHEDIKAAFQRYAMKRLNL